MSVEASVTYKDMGLKKLQENIQELRSLRVMVGYFDERGRETYPGSSVTVALLAAIHEFGSPGEQDIPARSFIRSTVHEEQNQIVAEEEKQLAEVVAGRKTPVNAMSEIARFITARVRNKLESSAAWATPLDPETIEEKGGDAQPLHDRGILAANLGWRVRKRGQTVAEGR